MIEHRMGERRGSIDLDSLAPGSIVYVGRGSFRMEAVDFDAPEAELGIVQAAPLVTTAPYGLDAQNEGRVIIELGRGASSSTWHAPDLAPLFGSQDNVPLLAAPTGDVRAEPTSALAISRAALAGVVALVFAGGLATASLVLQPRTASIAVASTAPALAIAAASVEVEPMAPPALDAPEPEAAPPKIQVESPVKIRVAKHVVHRAPSPLAAQAPVTTAWVDPFAD